MKVARGDQKRRHEAMRSLVNDFLHNPSSEPSSVVRLAVERGWGSRIKNVLSDFEDDRNGEIDKLCYQHYGEFLSSVTELLNVRKATEELRVYMIDLHDSCSGAGKKLLDTMQQVEAAVSERDEAARLCIAARECREVTQLMCDARVYISSKNFHKAVTTLREIQQRQSPHLQFINERVTDHWLVEVTQNLMEVELIEVDTFLSDTRREAPLYGSTLLRRQAALFRRRCILQHPARAKQLERYSFSTFFLWRLPAVFRLDSWAEPADFTKVVSAHFTQLPPSAGEEKLGQLFARLGPLCLVLHTCSVLGNMSEFAYHYRVGRRAEIDGVITGASKAAAQHGLAAAFSTLTSSVTGIFALECAFARGTCEYDDPAIPFASIELSQLWEQTCQRIMKLCLTHADSLSSPEELLCVKEELLLVAETVSDGAFELSTDPLIEITGALTHRLETLQIERLSAKVMDAFQTLLGRQHEVTTNSAFRTTVRCFGLDAITVLAGSLNQSGSTNVHMSTPSMSRRRYLSSFATQNFPQTFLFSGAVPVTMRELHLLVTHSFMHAHGCTQLGERGKDIARIVQKAFETVARIILDVIAADGQDITVNKACQLAADAAALNQASDSLWRVVETAITQFRWTESLYTHLPQCILAAKAAMDDATTQAQEKVIEVLVGKVDSLLSTLSFADAEPVSTPTACHPYVDEVTDFLRVTFICLGALPPETVEAAHFACCTRICEGVLRHLTSSRLQKINIRAIMVFEIDILKLQKFADECQTPYLRQCFNELADLISVLLSRDLPVLATDDSRGAERRAAYPALNLESLALVLEKLQPIERPPTHAAAAALTKPALRAVARQFRSLTLLGTR